jgi:hypothetical protein
MDKTRYWVVCGTARKATATWEEAESAVWEYFDGDDDVLILEDGDPRLKDYEDIDAD